ncbi:MAG: hypothetical protein MK105_13770 [Crocinitomicaceae bacterium]|nr:hypothetical protein [Crocinitomicaceae bacterium]
MWKKLFKKSNPTIEEPNKIQIIGWSEYDEKESIGTTGTENGKIIKDIEHSDGARITLEKDCGNIPFAITIGIYGLIFHTVYLSYFYEADDLIQQLKSIIEEIFNLYNCPEEQRDEEWHNKHDEFVNQIVEAGPK